MASVKIFICSCKKPFAAYYTKQMLSRETMNDCSPHWEEIDIEEERAGEIEAARDVMSRLGFEFIDARETNEIQCSCGRTIDLVRLIRGEEQ